MNLHMPLHTEENMLDMNWLQPAKELVKHNTQYIVFQKLRYFWVAKACYTKSIQYHIRLMTLFIDRVNRTIYELSLFRTDKVVALSESETSEYPATLFTCVDAIWTTRYSRPPGESPGIWIVLSSVEREIWPKMRPARRGIWCSCQNICQRSEAKGFCNSLIPHNWAAFTGHYSCRFHVSLRKQLSFFTPGPSGVLRCHSGRERRRAAVFAGSFYVGFSVVVVLYSYMVEYAFV